MQSRRDKEILQGFVSDISHQVKTPVANMKLYSGILQKPDLTEEKRQIFMTTLEEQIDKLDFLMQSLIHMSRLETGTFVLHPTEGRIHETIAQAMSAVWAKAEQKGIVLSVECDPEITVQHDPKWTAEALGNILDNAIEACRLIRSPEQRRISVKLLYKKNMLVCGFSNSMSQDVPVRAGFLTTKPSPEQHGLGLSNVREAAAKYGGNLNIRAEQGRFEVSFVLFGV